MAARPRRRPPRQDRRHGRARLPRRATTSSGIAQLKGDTLTAVDPDGQVAELLRARGDRPCREHDRGSSPRSCARTSPSARSSSSRTATRSACPARRAGSSTRTTRSPFYFPNGNYVDSVSAVNGFEYKAGADRGQHEHPTGNPEAKPINLEEVDFDGLQAKATTFRGTPGLDAEIKFFATGSVRIEQYTPPRYEDGHADLDRRRCSRATRRTTVTQRNRCRSARCRSRARARWSVGYTTETYTVDVPIYETQTVTRTRQDPVYENSTVEKTRQVPVYETQTTTCTRWCRSSCRTTTEPAAARRSAAAAACLAGEYVWQSRELPCQQNVLTGYTTETYTTTEQVQVGTKTVTWQEQVQVQVGTQQQTQTRQVPVYDTETYYVDVPVYEQQRRAGRAAVPGLPDPDLHVDRDGLRRAAADVDDEHRRPRRRANTIYIDGRITKLDGDLNGRVTIVGNEKVRVTGNLRYVDDDGDTAMLNGGDYTKPYTRNDQYDGNSVLGIIARDDVLLTNGMPAQAEVNATMLSTTGRVGIDGFQIDASGEPVKDVVLRPLGRGERSASKPTTARATTTAFTKDSLRRLGGIVCNDRILETYIQPRGDGTSYVNSGFKRGSMRFDFNLLFNPPPNFVEVPRPVEISIAPVYFMRGGYDE